VAPEIAAAREYVFTVAQTTKSFFICVHLWLKCSFWVLSFKKNFSFREPFSPEISLYEVKQTNNQQPNEERMKTTNKMTKILLGAALPALLALALGGACTLSAQTFRGGDVGTPKHAGSVSTVNGMITENGGGDDIWNQSDNFHFYYTAVAGDFDCVVRVQSFTGPDPWSKAELMVRESVADSSGNLVPAGGDRFFANMATQAAAGQNGVAAQWRDTQGGWATSDGWPNPMIHPGYPNCWLRLQRIGDVFFASYSPDGVNWNQYASTDASRTPGKPFNSSVLVGLAVTAHNNSVLSGATAVFSDFRFLSPPSPANLPTSVAVKAVPLWTPTGLSVKKNDNLVIMASGTWNYWSGVVPGPLGPDGDPNNPAPWDRFFSGAL
jgi:hypothetical protein